MRRALIAASLLLAAPAWAQEQHEDHCAPGIDITFAGVPMDVQTRLWVDGRLEFDSGAPTDPPRTGFNNMTMLLNVPDGEHMFRIQSPYADVTRLLRITERDRSLFATLSSDPQVAIYMRGTCATLGPVKPPIGGQ